MLEVPHKDELFKPSNRNDCGFLARKEDVFQSGECDFKTSTTPRWGPSGYTTRQLPFHSDNGFPRKSDHRESEEDLEVDISANASDDDSTEHEENITSTPMRGQGFTVNVDEDD